MNLERLTLGELDTNCYLLMDEEVGVAAIIDPADEGEFLSEKIARANVRLEAIILTHGHFDHVLGILPLKMAFGAEIILHKNDLSLYTKAPASARHWLKADTPILPKPDRFVKGKGTIVIGQSIVLEVIETPGHTPGSICLYERSEKVLFTGDTLFKSGVGRTDFSYASHEDLEKSLEKLAKLPPETVIYPGHGEPSTIGDELGGVDGNRTRA